MTNRFFTPNAQFIGPDGLPLSGGFLYFYASGSSTPVNTYSDSDLTIPNSNPIELDESGYAGNVFLQDVPYKVVLTDSDGNQIFTADPVYSSDYSTTAKFTVSNGSPNGTTAGTAGTFGGRPSDAVWDDINEVLYVCTTSGDAASAVWAAINESVAQATIPPQGYLTPTPGTVVITSDAIDATAVYYTPFIGESVPIYNGSTFIQSVFSELTLTLDTAHAANTLYDVMVFINGGVLTLVTSPAWSNSTAGSCVRGTGASSNQLQNIGGIWVNAVDITGRNGSTTYSVLANQATYLGTILINSTAGKVSCTVSYGQNRVWGIWNAYNRQPIALRVGDLTASWSTGTTTFHAMNANTGNKCTVLDGLAQERQSFQMSMVTSVSSVLIAGSSFTHQTGIGYNSTSTASGTTGKLSITVNQSFTGGGSPVSFYEAPPALGINNVTMLEANPGNGVLVGTGGENNNLMTARWRG